MEQTEHNAAAGTAFMKNPSNFNTNNFDLIRLAAAFQVALGHAFYIMQAENIYVQQILKFFSIFPGVPIFFFLSGFLISKSFENNSKLLEYCQNRLLRLYPALIACVLLSFAFIFLGGYWATTNATWLDWLGLFLAKTTFLQFYNPDFMRAYGDGVLNGSLWTICVELQFYIIVPLLYSIFKLKDSVSSNKVLIILIFFFLYINRLYDSIPVEHEEMIIVKLIGVSFLPWVYMFLTGVFFQRNFSFFYRLLSGRFFYILLFYIPIGIFSHWFKLELGNNIFPLTFFFLALLVFSFAYSFEGLSQNIIGKNDISYGVYIYHMPIINFFIYSGLSHQIQYSLFALLLTVLVSIASWRIIERPSLRLKKHPLNPLNRAGD